MRVTDFYLLKFQWVEEDPETGRDRKKKMEVLAEAVNYTDAESTANMIIQLEGLEKYVSENPEIIRQKAGAVCYNSCVLADKGVFDGITEMYVEQDRFYQVVVNDPVVNEDGEEKMVKITLIIPAKSTSDAEFYAKSMYRDCTVMATKVMPFSSVFMTNSTYESILKLWSDRHGL